MEKGMADENWAELMLEGKNWGALKPEGKNWAEGENYVGLLVEEEN